MTEREAFEAWMRDIHGPGVNLVRSDDGYISTVPHRVVRMTYASVEMLWEAWQAARAQPAQAVPLLTSQDIWDDDRIMGMNAFLGLPMDKIVDIVKVVEQAVRAKMGVAVPMTPQDHAAALDEAVDDGSVDEVDMWAFINGIKAAETFHGIVGKEGA